METKMKFGEPLHFECRICSELTLQLILDLGEQKFTGVFPRSETTPVPAGKLLLAKCKNCHLVQLADKPSLSDMYGDNYGYRSGLNQSMVDHLRRKVASLKELVKLKPGDLVIDIGSNDGTLLNTIAGRGLNLVGVDPVAGKFRNFYHPEIRVVEDFFPTLQLEAEHGRATLITSVAMFYDLEDPAAFVSSIRQALSVNGVWHFEQSYMPAMLEKISYDTVCHEHLEYYSLQVISDLLNAQGMKIIDVELNPLNGGSIAVTACKSESEEYSVSPRVANLLSKELGLRLDEMEIYERFNLQANEHQSKILSLVKALRDGGSMVAGYGASTKGNVLLQACGLGPDDLTLIGDVNPDKHGRYAPGSGIPIVSEEEMFALKPNYLLVLPWHFREFILEKETEFLARGGAFIFPLPVIEVVDIHGIQPLPKGL